MDQIKKKLVTHVRDVQHHGICQEKIHRQYKFTNFFDAWCRHNHPVPSKTVPKPADVILDARPASLVFNITNLL
jgi:hypothetical protein